MSRRISVGFVADLMSESALAQQQLLTNHTKEKMSVSRKSCTCQKREEGGHRWRATFSFKALEVCFCGRFVLTDHQGPSVVLQVFVLVENVHDSRQQRVQEGKNSYSQEKPRGRREITVQEENLIPLGLAERSLEMHFFQSRRAERGME